jgi:hypothetical protein
MRSTPEFELRANAFDLLGRAVPSAILGFAPPVAGLIAAACLACLTCPAPPPRWLKWSELLTSATIYVLTSALVSAAATLGTYVVLPRQFRNKIRETTLRTAAGAVWFAPLGVLLSQRSVWAVAAAVVLAVHVTSVLQLAHAGLHRAVEPTDADRWLPSAIFRYPHPPPSMASLLLPLCAGVSFQAAGAAALIGHIPMAAALSGLGAGVVASHRSRARSTISTGSVFNVAMMIALATVATTAGLARYLELEHQPALGGAGRSGNKLSQTTNVLLLGQRPTQFLNRSKHTSSSVDAVTDLVGSAYPGIVLLPEQQPHTVVISPLPAMRYGLLTVNRAALLSIPFFGVYWFFKAPDTSPPGNSLRVYGSPVEHTFRSTDHSPLFMEATQNFGTSIDLSCCSEIQIAISNADTYAGTVSLELILVDTILVHRPSQSLGIALVNSRPGWTFYGGRPPAQPETLTFAIPTTTGLHSFDEITIRFKLDAPRTDTGAKIAIQRFVFVPR